jgi:flagellar assembly factor FliW
VKVQTKAFGPVEVEEWQSIVFPQGLFGFEELKDYVLLDAEKTPFYWLQSIDKTPVAFVVVNPFLIRPDYEVNIGGEELAEIGIQAPEKALILAIVTIPLEGPMTVNLQGPLAINRDNRQGKQVILADSRWKTRHDVMAELEQGRG